MTDEVRARAFGIHVYETVCEEYVCVCASTNTIYSFGYITAILLPAAVIIIIIITISRKYAHAANFPYFPRALACQPAAVRRALVFAVYRITHPTKVCAART